MQYSKNTYDFKKAGKRELNYEKKKNLDFSDCRKKDKCVSKVVFTGALEINIWLLMAILKEL